ncbi:MAG: hypothetical protein HUU20_23680, partial [Pirellulales bacterium]|nr:hypothetical protein [Pirellulales bacterium]
MNRRELLAASASAGLSLWGFSSAAAQEKEKASPPGRLAADGKLAGRTLQQLRDRYRYDLFDDFLPFMDKHIIDHELGGFMCHADRDGTLLSTKKNAWYTGRGIWIYAYLYNELAPEDNYLQVARKSTEFILRKPPQGDDLWPAEYTKEGEPMPPQGQFIGGNYVEVSKEVYGDLFIASGLVEFGRAVKDPSYWDKAKQIVLKCVRVYDRPDYAPGAPKVYLGADAANAPELPGARLLAVWMLLIHTGSQMLAQRQDKEIQAIVDRS